MLYKLMFELWMIEENGQCVLIYAIAHCIMSKSYLMFTKKKKNVLI